MRTLRSLTLHTAPSSRAVECRSRTVNRWRLTFAARMSLRRNRITLGSCSPLAAISPYPRGTSCSGDLQIVHALIRQPGGILKRLTDILCFKIGIFLDDLPGSHAIRDQVQNKSDSYSHPADAGSSAHYVCVEGDAIKLLHGIAPMIASIAYSRRRLCGRALRRAGLAAKVSVVESTHAHG